LSTVSATEIYEHRPAERAGDVVGLPRVNVSPLRLRCNEDAVVEHQLAGVGEIARGDRVE
jgi:hypothetical protein